MTRKHRSVHRALWPIVALVVCFGLVMALVLRAPPRVESSSAAQEMRK
jgi:hypothetical protein